MGNKPGKKKAGGEVLIGEPAPVSSGTGAAPAAEPVPPKPAKPVISVKDRLVKQSGLTVIKYSDIKFDDDSDVGTGAAGAVVKATYNLNTVAVKKFFQEKDFLDELACLSELHKLPNVVPIYGICAEDCKWCIVMQYIGNGSLRHFLQDREKDYDWEFYLLLAKDIARVMFNLHQLGYMHRDLKPGNLLMASYSRKEEETRLVICDFGIAKKQDMTTTMLIGTPLYMGPELCGGVIPSEGQQPSYSKAVDVYAFGMILWELMTRTIPYSECSTMRQLFEAVKAGRRPKIPDNAPFPIRNLLQQCWQPNPGDRPTFEDLFNSLTKIQKMVMALEPPLNTLFQLKLSVKKEVTPEQELCAGIEAKLKAVLANEHNPYADLRVNEVLAAVQLAAGAMMNLDNVSFPPSEAKRKKGSVKRQMANLLEGLGEVIDEGVSSGAGTAYDDPSLNLSNFIANWFQFLPLEHLTSMLIRLSSTVLNLAGGAAITNDILFSIGLSKEGFAFWLKFVGDTSIACNWSDFASHVQSFAGEELDDMILYELKSFLDPADTAQVSAFKFAAFLTLFDNLEESTIYMHQLKTCPWFMGHIGKAEMSELLRFEPDGTFMLRFADGSYSHLTISYKAGGVVREEANIAFDTNLVSLETIKSYAPGLSTPYTRQLNWNGAFLGCTKSPKVVKLLTNLTAGTYILRLSASSPGCAAITYIAGDASIHHLLIKLLPASVELDGHSFPTVRHALEGYKHVFAFPGPMSEFHDDIPALITQVKDLVSEHIESNYDVAPVL